MFNGPVSSATTEEILKLFRDAHERFMLDQIIHRDIDQPSAELVREQQSSTEQSSEQPSENQNKTRDDDMKKVLEMIGEQHSEAFQEEEGFEWHCNFIDEIPPEDRKIYEALFNSEPIDF